MTPKTPTLKAVLDSMTAKQREQFARAAGTSIGSLRQIAAGRRGASALMAVRIDRAAAKRGLILPRASLNTGCAVCEYARTCTRTEPP
jgi:hypothetical protein